ncbi:MAG: transposase [Desulfuromonadales bacterium]|nr:transposase [Desulfuromonadales bacterium]
MPRQARIDAPGAVHHIICRGLERREIFRDDADRDALLLRLARIVEETQTPCFAWALMPNHFHLLLETGDVPIATVMRRLLTGYALWFNRRHDRQGHLFQNRYKSILCQRDRYFLELIRYIHLNPVRGYTIASLEDLATYRYSGHSRLTGAFQDSWQRTGEVLAAFADRLPEAREYYLKFVTQGLFKGKNLEATIIRGTEGWDTKAGQESRHRKSDERILGDSQFIASVLTHSGEKLMTSPPEAIGLHSLGAIVAGLLRIEVDELWSGGKHRKRTMARDLLCYWGTRTLRLTGSLLAAELNITQSAVSRAVQRGEKLAKERGWSLEKMLNRGRP